MFHRLRNYKCFAWALCLLLLNQQVIGKVEGRRRYESAFKDLFNKGESASNQLFMFNWAVNDNKELKQNTDKVIQFVKANPDKVGIAVGLAASSWLLYQSIVLAGEVGSFFDEIDDLKGQFNKYYLSEVPKLEQLFKQTRDNADHTNEEKQKEHFRSIYKELMKYYQDLQSIVDTVDDVIEDVNNGKNDAVISTAVSSTIVVLAGAALAVGGPVTLPAQMWCGGVGATLVMSSASTTLSLTNAHDLAKASAKLRKLKREIRRLRNEVMEKMMDIIQFV